MASYPDDNYKLGMYLGLSIHIGPGLIAKIIKENGKVVHRSTYQALTQKEWKQEECKLNIVYSWSPFPRGLALVLW